MKFTVHKTCKTCGTHTSFDTSDANFKGETEIGYWFQCVSCTSCLFIAKMNKELLRAYLIAKKGERECLK